MEAIVGHNARLHLPEQLRTANDIGCAHRFGIKLAKS
jgi:hypothetical protein